MSLFDYVMYFLAPFSDVMSENQFGIMCSNVAYLLISVFVGGFISAIFGGLSALLNFNKRGG